MRVLSIDASLRNTGVAVIDANNGKPRALYFGVIHNATKLRSSSCLVAIRDRLAELIHTHEPDCCALESVIYVQSYKTAIILGAARGAAILAAAEKGLPVFEYPPKRIKQSTVGRGGAAKNQVAFMVRALLGLTETPDADAADALAIALTHLRMHEAAARGLPGGMQI
jgi:crossover junction endodeoxyribonuclease RuvC